MTLKESIYVRNIDSVICLSAHSMTTETIIEVEVEQGLTSQVISGWVFAGQMTQPTVSKH